MHYRSYKSSPIIKFQKRVRFNKKISQYGKRAFNGNIKVHTHHIKAMRLHVLPSINANSILLMEKLTVENINTIIFKRESHDSHLGLGEIAKQQLDAIRDIKRKIRGLRKNQVLQENKESANQNEVEDDRVDVISRDDSISRLYHGQEESIGCFDMDSMSLSFQGFDAPTAQQTYPYTQNNILFDEQVDFDNLLFRNN